MEDDAPFAEVVATLESNMAFSFVTFPSSKPSAHESISGQAIGADFVLSAAFDVDDRGRPLAADCYTSGTPSADDVVAFLTTCGSARYPGGDSARVAEWITSNVDGQETAELVVGAATYRLQQGTSGTRTARLTIMWA